MSRSCYTDDYGDDFPGQLDLYRANVERSIRSRAGQARLKELRDALLALPVKRLEAEIFAEPSEDGPRVCGLGAWALAASKGDIDKAHDMVPRDADDGDTFMALQKFDWPKLVVYEAIYQNDTDFYEYIDGERRPETAEQRYARVLAWVTNQIKVGVND